MFTDVLRRLENKVDVLTRENRGKIIVLFVFIWNITNTHISDLKAQCAAMKDTLDGKYTKIYLFSKN